jgi:hypothetical protein
MTKEKDNYVFQKKNQKWSFIKEDNKPNKQEYESIEKAIDAMYQYFNSLKNDLQHSSIL